MRYTVAAIEDNIARLETSENKDIFISYECLPTDVKEGDILLFDGENYVLDIGTTEARRKAVYEKFNRLFYKE